MGFDAVKFRSAAMKVLNVAETSHGGLGTYFSFLFRYRSPEVVQFFIIPDRQDSLLAHEIPRRHFRHGGRNVGSILRLIVTVLSAKRRFEPDAIVFHSFFGIPPLLAARFLWPALPRVYVAHGWTTTHFARGSFKRKLADLCERTACRNATVCVSVSEAELRFAQECGLPGTHRLIANAVEAVEPSDDLGRAASESSGVEVLFVGRLDHQKGVDLLLRAYVAAAADNSNLRLRIIGAAARSDEENGGHAAPAGVEMLGWRPRDELEAYYARADLLVVPSRWEAYGLVVREAARHGTPSLVSDRGALPDLVEHGVDGYVFHLPENEDVSALTDALKRLSAEDLGRMRPRVRAKMAAERTAADMVDEFEDLLTSLVAGKRATTSRP